MDVDERLAVPELVNRDIPGICPAHAACSDRRAAEVHVSVVGSKGIEVDDDRLNAVVRRSPDVRQVRKTRDRGVVFEVCPRNPDLFVGRGSRFLQMGVPRGHFVPLREGVADVLLQIQVRARGERRGEVHVDVDAQILSRSLELKVLSHGHGQRAIVARPRTWMVGAEACRRL